METKAWHQHYDDSVPRSLDLEELNVWALFERTAKKHPERKAVAFLNASLTYAELLEDVERLGTAMAELGVRPGQRVAIQLPNIPQTPIAYYAALSIGAQVVMTNPLYMPPEIEHQWNDAEVVLAVTTDFIYDQKIADLRPSVGVENYLIASIPEYLRFPLNWLAPFKLKRQDPPSYAKVPFGNGVHPFKKLLRSTAPHPPRPEIDFEGLAVLQYTGGTTGVSKGAMLTHRNLSTNVQQCAAWFAEMKEAEEVVLTALPLFHVFGMTVCMNFGTALGMTLALVPNPRDIDALLKTLAKEKVTFLPAVPAIFNALNHHPDIERLDVSSIKACISGSAPIAPDVLERFEALTGSRITEGFGLSETSPVTHVNPMQGERRIGWVGIPVPDTDARVVDVEDGQKVLSPGEEGELVIRGPQVMQGYWKQPEETANSIRDGWFFTGDLAVMSEDGFFKIVGRKKDMINCNGLKVFPDEVDALLVSHDAILEAATIGVPDPKRGETVKSFIVLQPGRELDAEAVQSFCREHLAAYKIPREIEFLDELPKSSVLKVLRRELRERELAKRG